MPWSEKNNDYCQLLTRAKRQARIRFQHGDEQPHVKVRQIVTRAVRRFLKIQLQMELVRQENEPETTSAG